MNYVKIFDENGELKYTVLPQESADSDSDGLYISSLNATYYGDDTATEWTVSECELKIVSKIKPKIYQRDKVQIWHDDECFGDFFVIEDVSQSGIEFTVQCVDSVYFLDDIYFAASQISGVSFPVFIETLSGDFIENNFDDNLNDKMLTATFPNGYTPNNNVSATSYTDLVSGSGEYAGNSYYLPNLDANGRSLVQYAMESAGVTATTFKTTGIRYKSCELDKSEIRRYSEDEVFDGATAEKKDISYNNISLQGLKIVFDSTLASNSAPQVNGLIKVDGDTSGDLFSMTITPNTNVEFLSATNTFGDTYYLTAKPYYSVSSPYNGLKDYISVKGNLRLRDFQIRERFNYPTDDDVNDVYMSDFCSVFENYDGSVTFQWDMAAVRQYDSQYKKWYPEATGISLAENSMQYVDEETGDTYMRIAFMWYPLFTIEGASVSYPFSIYEYSKIKLYETANETIVVNPFFQSDNIDTVIANSYKAIDRDTTITFKVKYSGENMGDVISVKIDDTTYIATIKQLDCSFSYSNVFCTITADVLSENELKDIIARYGTATYGISMYSSKGVIQDD